MCLRSFLSGRSSVSQLYIAAADALISLSGTLPLSTVLSISRFEGLNSGKNTLLTSLLPHDFFSKFTLLFLARVFEFGPECSDFDLGNKGLLSRSTLEHCGTDCPGTSPLAGKAPNEMLCLKFCPGLAPCGLVHDWDIVGCPDQRQEIQDCWSGTQQMSWTHLCLWNWMSTLHHGEHHSPVHRAMPKTHVHTSESEKKSPLSEAMDEEELTPRLSRDTHSGSTSWRSDATLDSLVVSKTQIYTWSTRHGSSCTCDKGLPHTDQDMYKESMIKQNSREIQDVCAHGKFQFLNAKGHFVDPHKLYTAATMSLSKESRENFFENLLNKYLKSLKERPLITKCCTRFCVSAPIIHYFYIFLSKVAPPKDKPSQVDNIKRLLIDRLIFTPPFIVLFLYVVTILEGQGSAEAVKKIREQFWTILKMNWKVWTIFTYININYIPQRYRVLFGNTVGLFWTVFIAIKRKQITLLNIVEPCTRVRTDKQKKEKKHNIVSNKKMKN
ncbi:PXMP2-like protein [Mya arenaria]|uniref:PXMP2-like protein n=1 Tax=Mya arenaria TaxID=6604 RepID=A0ABY7E1J9_MYAAR|nr:PXMP2-like protein [Mya arenaria]